MDSCGTAAASLAPAGSWLVHASVKANDWDNSPKLERISQYLRLTEELRRFLWVLSGVLGLSILATRALGKVRPYSGLWVLAAGESSHKLLPSSMFPVTLPSSLSAVISLNHLLVCRHQMRNRGQEPIQRERIWKTTYK